MEGAEDQCTPRRARAEGRAVREGSTAERPPLLTLAHARERLSTCTTRTSRAAESRMLEGGASSTEQPARSSHHVHSAGDWRVQAAVDGRAG